MSEKIFFQGGGSCFRDIRYSRSLVRMPRKLDFDSIGSTTAEEQHQKYKQLLRDWDAVRAALPEVDAQFIRDTRKKMRCSRALFARRLCMSERTLEKWEQGRAKPNAQAAVLLLLVRHFPDTLERLRGIAIPEPGRRKRTGAPA